MKKIVLSLAVTLAVGACAMMQPPPPPLNDGELALPADYKTWPKFLSNIQKVEAKQIREIYVNPKGHTQSTREAGFPYGTQFVMEIYGATPNADGTLSRGNLAKVFVMGKDKGWGAGAAESLKNGEWVYSAYLPDGKASSDSPVACRGCHLPLAPKDFVARYDEYFDKRAK
jgi:hemoglobin